MKDYLLLFRGGDTERQQLSPEEIQSHMGRWQTWIGEMAQKGQLIGAQPLNTEGKVISGKAKKLTDGPFMEGKEIIGGYVHVKVAHFDEAISISNGCPNLEFESGTVEIREIGTMSPV